MTLRVPILVAGVLALLLAAGPVAADCDPAGPIEDELATAPVAFVGKVIDLDGSTATFAVSEVWAGEVPAVVEVHGLFGPDPRDPESDVGPVVSEDDRSWKIGTTYLVVPTVDGEILHDHICTATTEWQPELEPLRLAGARIVTSEDPDNRALPLELIVVGAVIVLGAGASALAFRRR